MPCFFVLCKGYSDDVYRGRRWRVRADIVIEFIADNSTGDINSVINDTAERLYDAVYVINTDEGISRGIDRKCEKSERGCTFYVSYEYFYYRSDESCDSGDVMEILKQEGDVKNGCE